MYNSVSDFMPDSIDPKYVEVNVGDSLLIHCEGSSMANKATWIFDKPTLDHHTITKSKDHTNIVFDKITILDSGTYTCIVNKDKVKVEPPFLARAVVKVIGMNSVECTGL